MKYFVSLSLLLSGILLASCKKSSSEPAKSAAKEITSFSFQKDKNTNLDADYSGTINGTAISISIPNGFDVTLLKASFTFSDKAVVSIGQTAQTSGVTVNDFTHPVTYTVTAEDNSVKTYTVTIGRTGITANSNINYTTSFYLWNQNYFHTNIGQFIQSVHGAYRGDEFNAQAFYDFDKDGDKDLISGSFNYDNNTAIDIHFYRNNGGAFTKDQSAFGGTVPQFVHSRQIILGDFDKNGWMDVVFAAHGYDKSPFPGEQQKILLNNNGVFTANNIPLPTSNGEFTFNHSVCSGDIDNDGDLDLFFTNNMRLATSGIFMKNNGNGTFTYDATIFPGDDIKYKPCFTSQLFDLDNDGYLDLLIAGHDRDQNVTSNQGLKPTILWGNYTGRYSVSRMTQLPVIVNYGVSNSITFLDYDKDSKTDILIGKTGDGAGTLSFYQGYGLQLLKNNGNRSFSDVSSAIQNNATTTGGWVVWFLAQDADGDGDTDIMSADKWYNLQWRNDNGTFVKY